MREIVYKDAEGHNVTASVLGFFKVSEIDKEFVMYSIVDDDEAEDEGVVLLGEVVRNEEDENDIQILGIESEEKDLVMAYYNEIASQIGGSEDE